MNAQNRIKTRLGSVSSSLNGNGEAIRSAFFACFDSVRDNATV